MTIAPRRFGRAAALGLAVCAMAAAVGGCKTAPKEDGAAGPPPAAATVLFDPQQYLAKIHAEEGPYPNLYAPDSYALWVGPEVTAQRRSEAEAAGEAAAPEADAIAPVIAEKFVVFEVHLISLFADMSIGYDAVGLRNVDVYLRAPNGARIDPVQRIVGGALDESMQGAIRVFRRTCLVVFPKDALGIALPVRPEADPGARLVLEALDTSFFFEWQPVLSADQIGTPLLERRFVQAAKMGYNQFYSAIAGVLHTLD